jgi:2-C-methyl-D-erythritol 4-phosphate cytidylyltransferase
VTERDLTLDDPVSTQPVRNQADCWMLIPAAGVGQRMGSSIPKQYLAFQGKTLLEWTLEQCLQIESISHIWVAVSPEDRLIDSLDTSIDQSRVTIIKTGAESRFLTVLNTLKALQPTRNPLKQAPWVMVHDAVRPCIQPQQVMSLLAAAGVEGALLAYPIQDTVKRLGAGHKVEQTIDRSALWLAQTPQLADFDTLLRALQHVQSLGLTITDEASALEAIGLHPKVVLGSVHNRKMTRPEDLEWFKYYLAVNQPTLSDRTV